jgi:hypothetical protein
VCGEAAAEPCGFAAKSGWGDADRLGAALNAVWRHLEKPESVPLAVLQRAAATDTVDMFVQDLLRLDASGPRMEAQNASHPLTRRERVRQAEDLELLDGAETLSGGYGARRPPLDHHIRPGSFQPGGTPSAAWTQRSRSSPEGLNHRTRRGCCPHHQRAAHDPTGAQDL